MIPNKILLVGDFLTENWKWLLTAAGAVIAWFRNDIGKAFNRTIQKTESEASVEKINLENLSKAVNVYKELMDDIIPRYDKQIDLYKAQLEKYHKQVENYRQELKERDKEIVLLHKEVNLLSATVARLEYLVNQGKPH
jgi:peptidoglycan hydrolase CwlO-like protein